MVNDVFDYVFCFQNERKACSRLFANFFRVLAFPGQPIKSSSLKFCHKIETSFQKTLGLCLSNGVLVVFWCWNWGLMLYLKLEELVLEDFSRLFPDEAIKLYTNGELIHTQSHQFNQTLTVPWRQLWGNMQLPFQKLYILKSTTQLQNSHRPFND